MIINNKITLKYILCIFIIVFGISNVLIYLTDDFILNITGRIITIGFLFWVSIVIWKKLEVVEKQMKESKGSLVPSINITYIKYVMIIISICLSTNTLAYQFKINDYGIPIMVMLGVVIMGLTSGMIPMFKPTDNEFRGKK